MEIISLVILHLQREIFVDIYITTHATSASGVALNNRPTSLIVTSSSVCSMKDGHMPPTRGHAPQDQFLLPHCVSNELKQGAPTSYAWSAALSTRSAGQLFLFSSGVSIIAPIRVSHSRRSEIKNQMSDDASYASGTGNKATTVRQRSSRAWHRNTPCATRLTAELWGW
jgi:hypothetical protein